MTLKLLKRVWVNAIHILHAVWKRVYLMVIFCLLLFSFNLRSPMAKVKVVVGERTSRFTKIRSSPWVGRADHINQNTWCTTITYPLCAFNNFFPSLTKAPFISLWLQQRCDLWLDQASDHASSIRGEGKGKGKTRTSVPSHSQVEGVICINLDRCVPIHLSSLFSSMVHRRCCIGSLFSLSTFMPWPLSSHAWLLACSCLATTTTTMAINTLALHCTALHMTPFIGMHGWVQVFVMPWWVEEIQQVCFTMAWIWVRQTCLLPECLLLPCSNWFTICATLPKTQWLLSSPLQGQKLQ